MISFACGGCGRRLKVNDEMAGRRSKCPQCGRPLCVPTASQPSAVRASAAAAAEARTLPPRPISQPTKSAAGAELETTSAASPPNGRDPPPEQYDFLAPPQAPDELGRLGPYRVLEVLGAGGMGVVFRAEDPMLKRPVALKAMLPTLAVSDSSKKRFLREAQAVAAIDHDHIVHVYQVGEDRGVPFLAMQFLRGEPLDERLRREPRLPAAEAVRIGGEIASGLAAAHAKGLIHRDVKPANVWLEGEAGRVKVLDFGLARAAADGAHLTQTGAIIGTPAYMAPEQANSQAVDARCDLFSLGCVLYQMTTGERPFKGTDMLSTLMAVATDHPPPPAEVCPEVPAALSELVMRLLCKDPDGRPESAGAVVEALKGVGVGRARKGKPAVAVAEEGPEAPTRSVRPGRPRAKGVPKRRQTKGVLGGLRAMGARLAVAVAAGVIGASTLVVLVGVWWLSTPWPRSPTGPVSPTGPAVAVNYPSPNADGGAAPPARPPPEPDNRGGQTMVNAPPAKADPPRGLDFDERGVPRMVNAPPAKADPPTPPPVLDEEAAANRKAAEWVLRLGAADPESFELGICMDKGGDVTTITKEVPLPPRPFWVNNIVLINNPKVDDEALKVLQGLTEVKELNFGNCGIRGDGLKYLRGMTHLRQLGLANAQMRDQELADLKGFKELQDLDLSSTPITDEGLEHLRGMTLLQSLNLSVTDTGGGGLDVLKDMTHMRVLHAGAGTDDKGLAVVKGMKQLEELFLQPSRVTDAGLANLEGLPYLKTFSLCDSPGVTDAGLEHLSRCTGLEHLYLGPGRMNVKGPGLKHLEGLLRLQSLALQGTWVTDEGLKPLKNFKRLPFLILSNTTVTDAGLDHLKQIGSLRTLMLTGTRVTDAGVKKFKEALPTCDIQR